MRGGKDYRPAGASAKASYWRIVRQRAQVKNLQTSRWLAFSPPAGPPFYYKRARFCLLDDIHDDQLLYLVPIGFNFDRLGLYDSHHRLEIELNRNV